MSASTAIAAVTAELVVRLKAAMKAADFVEAVTAGPPDAMRKGQDGPQLNLFLYQTAVDGGWRNQDVPGRPPGRKPILPLRLHYLLTVYSHETGDDRPQHDVFAHRLLGEAMLALHVNPLVPAGDQPDPARVTLLPLTPDDISKLWAGFQAPYRLSVAYEATPVLIEPASPASSPLPVLARGGVTIPKLTVGPGGGGGPGAGPAASGKPEEVGIHVRASLTDPTAELAVPPTGLRGLRLVPANTPVPVGPRVWFPDLLTLTGRGLATSEVKLLFAHAELGAWVAESIEATSQADARLAVRVPHGLKDIARYDPSKYDTAPLPQLPPGEVTPTDDPATWPPGEYTVAAATEMKVPGLDAGGNEVTFKRLVPTTPVRFAVLPAVAAGSRLVFVTRQVDGETVADAAQAVVAMTTLLPDRLAARVELFLGGRELSPAVADDDGTRTVVRWNATDATVATALFREIGAEKLAALPQPAGPLVRVRVAGLDSPVTRTAVSSGPPDPTFDPALRTRLELRPGGP